MHLLLLFAASGGGEPEPPPSAPSDELFNPIRAVVQPVIYPVVREDSTDGEYSD